MAKSSTPTADKPAEAPAVTDPFATLAAVDADAFLPELNVSPAIVAMVDALTPTTPKALPIDALTPDLVKKLLRDVRAYGKRQGKKVMIRQGVLAGKPALKFTVPAPKTAAAGK